jgi:hypothetical protein
MGRPIKKKFFGNLNKPGYGSVSFTSGVGGEGTGAILVTNTGTGYSRGAVAVFSNPAYAIAQGWTTTGTPVFTADGNNQFGITAITVLKKGRGYETTATITINTATAVAASATGNSGLLGANTFTVAGVTGIALGMTIAGGGTGNNGKVTNVDSNLKRITSSVNNLGTWTNAANITFNDYGSGAKFITSLTTTTQNALSVSAYIPVVGAAAKIADIVKQEASHRYLVKTGDGMGQCKLTATDTLVSGEMNLIATDSLGSTYWVTKLTARRCVLTQRTNGGSGYEFDTNNSAGWTLNAPSTGVVSVANF